MSNNQFLGSSYTSPARNSAMMHFQTSNPYAALVVTAGPEHDGRSSSSASPPSSVSSASLFAYTESVNPPETPSQSHFLAYSSSRMLQQHAHRLPEQARNSSVSAGSTPTRSGYSTRTPDSKPLRAIGPAPISSAISVTHTSYGYQTSPAPHLVGVPESVAVQEMAFRQGQLECSSSADSMPANPFAGQFDQLWKVCYKLGQECGGKRAIAPANASQQVFAWPVLINPYTQTIENPYGALDPAWSRKMIQAALNCMDELIRVTCRRNSGWDKTVADIPLPAQEALVAFPDLAHQYEQLKRDAKEARAGGRPYGY